MGRLQDLERLALGRSAFQDVETNELDRGQSLENRSLLTPEQERERGYFQQYDSKGRPINASVEHQNQIMRNAQNAVLALVGVVEVKDAPETQKPDSSEARKDLHKSECETMNDLDFATLLLHGTLTWWTSSLVSRIQAGVYPPSKAFTDIVSRDVSNVRSGSVRRSIDTFFPGCPISILCVTTKVLLCAGLKQVVGRLQGWFAKRLSRKTFNAVNRLLVGGFNLTLVVVEIAFLPLQYHALTQVLGLAPTRPILPDWGVLQPPTPSSVHSFIWRPLAATQRFGILGTPAVLLLLQNLMSSDFEGFASISNHAITLHRVLRSKRSSGLGIAGLPLLPLRALYLQVIHIRDELMIWLKWNVDYRRIDSGAGTIHENENDMPYPLEPPPPLAVPLTLCYLPERIDDLFYTLLLMPWRSTVLRVVTQSFLNSTWPKTPQAISLAVNMYSPLGGGPLAPGALDSSAARWSVFSSYVNNLGLSLMLNTSVEIGLFFIVYRLTRWQGLRYFNWGRRQTKGSVNHRSTETT